MTTKTLDKLKKAVFIMYELDHKNSKALKSELGVWGFHYYNEVRKAYKKQNEKFYHLEIEKNNKTKEVAKTKSYEKMIRWVTKIKGYKIKNKRVVKMKV